MDAGCAHTGDPPILVEALDAGGATGYPKLVYSSSGLTVFDVGGIGTDIPVGLTSDGSQAVVEDGVTGDVYFYDTTSQMLTRKTNIPGDPGLNGASTVAGNGNRIGAWYARSTGDASSSIVGAVWDQCAGWMFPDQSNPAGCLDDPATMSAVNELNEDGTIAVGFVWSSCSTHKALKWTYANGAWTPTVLPTLSNGDEAYHVSRSGNLIGGSVPAPANSLPAVWFDGGGVMLDPTLSGNNAAVLYGVSADGTMVTGYWNTFSPEAGVQINHGFYWSLTDTAPHFIPVLPGAGPDDDVRLYAIADQNQLIFGKTGTPGTYQAAYWTASGGLQLLKDAASAQGINLPSGVSFYDVYKASDDGTVLLGSVLDNNVAALNPFHNFVLRMPVSAYGL